MTLCNTIENSNVRSYGKVEMYLLLLLLQLLLVVVNIVLSTLLFVRYLVTHTAVVCCLQIRENHRQKEKEMKNFAELVSRTSKHSTLEVRFHTSYFYSHAICDHTVLPATWKR